MDGDRFAFKTKFKDGYKKNLTMSKNKLAQMQRTVVTFHPDCLENMGVWIQFLEQHHTFTAREIIKEE